MTKIKKSYGILLYRFNAEKNNRVEVFLGHANAPKFWSRSHKPLWCIPKGRKDKGVDESNLATAKREFHEEVGILPPDVPYVKFEKYKTPHRNVSKRITIYVGDATGLDISYGGSMHHIIEFPAKSKKYVEYFEMDDADWFSEKKAIKNALWGQRGAIRDFFKAVKFK